MSNNYLVVCQTLKRAAYIHTWLVNYLVSNRIPCRVIKTGPYILIDLLEEQMTIRFTSIRKYEEIALGLHDWFEVTGEQVEEWLNAAKYPDE